MALKIDAYPGLLTRPSGSLYPGLPLTALDNPAGFITGADGSAVPYLAILAADQQRDRRLTVIDALNSTNGFTLGPALPARPTWKLRLLVRTLEQAQALDNLAAASASFTISEWLGRNWTLTGQTSMSANVIPGQAAWWTLDMEVIQL